MFVKQEDSILVGLQSAILDITCLRWVLMRVEDVVSTVLRNKQQITFCVSVRLWLV